MGELACKLGRFVFGEDFLKTSNVFGCSGFDPLPPEGLVRIKDSLLKYRYPSLIHKTNCIKALNHICSRLRRESNE